MNSYSCARAGQLGGSGTAPVNPKQFNIGLLAPLLPILAPVKACIYSYLMYFPISIKFDRCQVTLEKVEADEEVPDFTKRLRTLQKNDRAVFDKANRAFVSYIKAYSKHECHLLLRIKGKLECPNDIRNH